MVGAVFGTHALAGVQLTNCCPKFGEAFSVTVVPGANDVPVSCCETVPPPTTTRLNITFVANVAEALVSWFKTNVQGTLPLLAHGPLLQLMKDELEFGVGVSVIVVLFANEVPVGVCVIVPGPETLVENVYFVTVVTPLPVTEAWTLLPGSGPFV